MGTTKAAMRVRIRAVRMSKPWRPAMPATTPPSTRGWRWRARGVCHHDGPEAPEGPGPDGIAPDDPGGGDHPGGGPEPGGREPGGDPDPGGGPEPGGGDPAGGGDHPGAGGDHPGGGPE